MLLHTLPLDPDGVYVVLGGAEVTATSGFCSSYCGWHTSSGGLRFAFVGDATQCPFACAWQSTASPHWPSWQADAMVNILAHELTEAATDPDFTGYFFNNGNENADQCAWKFAPTVAGAGTAGVSNLQTTGSDGVADRWLVQQNWDVATAKCALG